MCVFECLTYYLWVCVCVGLCVCSFMGVSVYECDTLSVCLMMSVTYDL